MPWGSACEVAGEREGVCSCHSGMTKTAGTQEIGLACASLVAQLVKNLPEMRTQVQPLGREDPLEKEMATHSSILAWKIPCTEEPGGLQSRGSQRVGYIWATTSGAWPGLEGEGCGLIYSRVCFP